MVNILNNTLEFYMFSPLDQFGDDDDNFFVGLFADTLTHLVPNVWYIDEFIEFTGVNEVEDLGDWTNILVTILGNAVFDDEDAGDSEWEENDMTASNMQATIFSTNILGMVPGVETNTAEASLTFLFSISTMVTIMLIGVSIHSIRYLSILYPTGTPAIMAPFIIIIEFVSYISRAVSLGMRLFANMFAGHSLVKILMSFAWLFLNSVIPVLSVPVFILLLAIFLMEVGIAYLQSYVFGALSSMYLEDVILLDH